MIEKTLKESVFRVLDNRADEGSVSREFKLSKTVYRLPSGVIIEHKQDGSVFAKGEDSLLNKALLRKLSTSQHAGSARRVEYGDQLLYLISE